MSAPEQQPAPLGANVLYCVTEQDCALVLGKSNPAKAGMEFPAVVVRRWSGTTANLLVFVDGDRPLWCTSRVEGTGPGTYRRP